MNGGTKSPAPKTKSIPKRKLRPVGWVFSADLLVFSHITLYTPTPILKGSDESG